MDKTTAPKTKQTETMRNISCLVFFLSGMSLAKAPANLEQSVEIFIQAYSVNKKIRCLTPHLKDIALYGNQLPEAQKLQPQRFHFLSLRPYP